MVQLVIEETPKRKPSEVSDQMAKACAKGKRDSTAKLDEGYDDKYRGWYDVQGCGQCLDYCRWVGYSGSGGNPADQTEKGKSYWSCDLAGSGDPYTAKGHFGTKFEHHKCAGVNSTVAEGDAQTRKHQEKQKKKMCAEAERHSSSVLDFGHEDKYRGWYDVQGCGQCLDYCRWVGYSGSGGDPAKLTQKGMGSKYGGSYWSCALAGSSNTDSGHFGSKFQHKQCT